MDEQWVAHAHSCKNGNPTEHWRIVLFANVVAVNADGYGYIIAPTLDGQPPHGFKVDGGLNVISDNPTMGLARA